MKQRFRVFLRQIFQEADKRYQDRQSDKPERKEGRKDLVAPTLVEKPVADALFIRRYDMLNTEVGEKWFYLSSIQDEDIDDLASKLYTSPRSKYNYDYIDLGRTERIVRFDLEESTFWINTDHPLVIEYVGNSSARRLLEDFVTTETLLEIYLRENHVGVSVIEEILKKRDDLFQALVEDRSYSFETISNKILDSVDDEHELEINVVVATRALGFNSKHISGSGKPDGLARYFDHPQGPKLITLEAKSSTKDEKRVNELDVDGVKIHMDEYEADGALLVAPGYVGGDKNDTKVSKSARNSKISCWTVEQLSDVVKNAESRHINARQVYEIVTTCFSPKDVENAINQLLSEPEWSEIELYIAILNTLRNLNNTMADTRRNLDHIYAGLTSVSVEINGEAQVIRGVEKDHVRKAVRELSSVSKGALIFDDKDNINITTSLEELENRVSSLTKTPTKQRRKSSFRNDQ
jgi:hypothetical protein